jgi:syntaxin 1B/2/3
MQDTSQFSSLSTQQQNLTNLNAILDDCHAIGRAINDLESRLAVPHRSQREFNSSCSVSSKELDALSADIMSDYRELGSRVKGITCLPRIPGSQEQAAS